MPNLFGHAHTPLKCIGQLTIDYVLQLIHYTILCVWPIGSSLVLRIRYRGVIIHHFGWQDSPHLISTQ